jgi:DNA-binding NarL/FixJ family response regulator
MNVLVVEDEAAAREILRSVALVGVPEACVQAAADLQEALEMAAETHPDVVLLELGLPSCRGMEAVECFRKALPHVVILAVSSQDDRETIAQALRAGANGFLPKGVSAAGIAALLRGDNARAFPSTGFL